MIPRFRGVLWDAAKSACVGGRQLIHEEGRATTFPRTHAVLFQSANLPCARRARLLHPGVVEQNRHEHEVVGVREAVGPHPFLAESLAVAGVLHQREAIDGKRLVAMFWRDIVDLEVSADAQLHSGPPPLWHCIDHHAPLHHVVVIVATEDCARVKIVCRQTCEVEN